MKKRTYKHKSLPVGRKAKALPTRGREDRKKFSLDWKVSKVSSKEYIKNHLFFLNDIPYGRQCANISIYKCVCSHFLPFFALFSTSHHLMIKMYSQRINKENDLETKGMQFHHSFPFSSRRTGLLKILGIFHY